MHLMSRLSIIHSIRHLPKTRAHTKVISIIFILKKICEEDTLHSRILAWFEWLVEKICASNNNGIVLFFRMHSFSPTNWYQIFLVLKRFDGEFEPFWVYPKQFYNKLKLGNTCFISKTTVLGCVSVISTYSLGRTIKRIIPYLSEGIIRSTINNRTKSLFKLKQYQDRELGYFVSIDSGSLIIVRWMRKLICEKVFLLSYGIRYRISGGIGKSSWTLS